jgi:arsenate reductase (glutaredoxin)
MSGNEGTTSPASKPDGVRIYHNPRCSKSRETLRLIVEHGVELEIVLYLDDPPGKAELEDLLDRLGLKPSELARKGEEVFQELGLATAAENEVLEAMLANPVLIERPIVVTANAARLGRPPETVREILPVSSKS